MRNQKYLGPFRERKTVRVAAWHGYNQIYDNKGWYYLGPAIRMIKLEWYLPRTISMEIPVLFRGWIWKEMIYNCRRNFPYVEILGQNIWDWCASDIRVVVIQPVEWDSANKSQLAYFDETFYMP